MPKFLTILCAVSVLLLVVTGVRGTANAGEVSVIRHSLVRQLIYITGDFLRGIQRQHLDYYLDEFPFRFNRRRSRTRGLLFHCLAQQAVAVAPAPYRALVA